MTFGNFFSDLTTIRHSYISAKRRFDEMTFRENSSPDPISFSFSTPSTYISLNSVSSGLLLFHPNPSHLLHPLHRLVISLFVHKSLGPQFLALFQNILQCSFCPITYYEYPVFFFFFHLVSIVFFLIPTSHTYLVVPFSRTPFQIGSG